MFDDTLLESRSGRRGRGKRVGLPLAIGLHAAVLGAFVGASISSVADPPEPSAPLIFPVSMGPPPPQGEGGGHSASRATVVLRQARVIEALRALPADEPNHRDPTGPERPAYPGLEKDGQPGDPADGVPRGTGDKPVVGPRTDESDRVYQPGGDVRPPELLQRIEPVYSEAARRAHIEGTVILEAIITSSGDVEEIRVTKAANPLLTEAAERAVRQWRYKPATLNGRAVRVLLTVTVTFGISD